jgi:hypothetical protein
LQLLQTPWLLQPPLAQVWQASPPAPQATSVFPARHRLPSQHPAAQLLPSQMHAPPMQCWPALQLSPAPQAQVPLAAQPSLNVGSQVTHAAPAVPHDATEGDTHTPVAQQPLGQVTAVQALAPSRRQPAEQPSPDTTLPSSHSSIPPRRCPSPQIAGSPSVKVSFTSWPARTTTACWSLPTMTSPARPSTRTSTVVSARASGSSRTAVSSPLVRGRGGFGKDPGGNAGWSPIHPETAKDVICFVVS